MLNYQRVLQLAIENSSFPCNHQLKKNFLWSLGLEKKSHLTPPRNDHWKWENTSPRVVSDHPKQHCTKLDCFFFITNHFSMHHSEWIPCDKSTVYPGDSISLASRHPPKTNIKHNTDRQRLTFCIEESHCDVRNSEMSVANLDWKTGQ